MAKPVPKTAGPKNKGGRPSKYSDALIREICIRLADSEPLACICRDEGMPDPSTVWDWMQAKPEVSQAIAHARNLGWDAIAHRARATARGEGDSKQDVQRDKLIIETDLKLLAKWDPKRYGEKLQQEISGPDGGPIEHKYAALTDEQLAAEIARRAAALRQD